MIPVINARRVTGPERGRSHVRKDSAVSCAECASQIAWAYLPAREWPTKARPSKSGRGDRLLGAPEVWAYGLRNPWRLSFAPNGDVWIADVGEAKEVEINCVDERGATSAGHATKVWHALVNATPPD